MKHLILLYLLYIQIFTSRSQQRTVNASCSYTNHSTLNGTHLFTCTLKDDPKINARNIFKLIIKNPNYSNVTRFEANDKTIYYFPKKIEEYFSKLEKITISNSKLREITSDDLKVHKELKDLDLSRNEIEKLSGDLFKLNHKLENINFNQNNISMIDPITFTRMNNLKLLALKNNKCVSDMAKDFDSIQDMIEKMKIQCSPFICNIQDSVNKNMMAIKFINETRNKNQNSTELVNLSENFENCTKEIQKYVNLTKNTVDNTCMSHIHNLNFSFLQELNELRIEIENYKNVLQDLQNNQTFETTLVASAGNQSLIFYLIISNTILFISLISLIAWLVCNQKMQKIITKPGKLYSNKINSYERIIETETSTNQPINVIYKQPDDTYHYSEQIYEDIAPIEEFYTAVSGTVNNMENVRADVNESPEYSVVYKPQRNYY